MQLAAQRIALNLREAGFNVQVASAGARSMLIWSCEELPLEGADPAAALEQVMRNAGAATPRLKRRTRMRLSSRRNRIISTTRR